MSLPRHPAVAYLYLVRPKVPVTTKHKEDAIGIAQAWMRKQPWHNRYLLGRRSVDVVDRESHWWCVFKTTDWRTASPGRGIVAVHKRTGRPSWIKATPATTLYV